MTTPPSLPGSYALVRRLRRRWTRPPGPLRWTLLLSIWAHVGALVVLGLSAHEASTVDNEAGPWTVHRVVGAAADGPGPLAEAVGANDLGPRRSLVEGAIGAGAVPGHAEGARAPGGASGTSDDAGAAVDDPPRDRVDEAPVDLHPVPGEPERRASSEPAPPPEPAAPPDEPDEWQRFARTEAEQAVETPPDDWLAISAHDTTTDSPRRAPVTSEHLGPLRERADGPADASGSPTLRRHEGLIAPRLGNRDRAEEGFVPVGGGGGGQAGESRGSGASQAGGQRLAGGPAARRAAGSATPGAAAGGAGPAPAVVAPPAPSGQREQASETPSWWRPTAVRVVVPEPPVIAAAADRGGAPSPSSGRGIALRETVATFADRGGTDALAPDEAALPTDRRVEVGTHRVAPPGTADPAEELREALGWGPIDRSQLGPRPAWAGTLGHDGQRDSSPRSPFADVPIDWTTSLTTRGTPLGEWVQRAEEIVDERWRHLDLGTHDRAVGIAGQVTVRYVVRPGGRVVDKWVDLSSGHPTLDDMALSAIPSRLPRLPKEAEHDVLHHRVTLRYRNPLVATGTPDP